MAAYLSMMGTCVVGFRRGLFIFGAGSTRAENKRARPLKISHMTLSPANKEFK